jgi:hypothetical protein
MAFLVSTSPHILLVDTDQKTVYLIHLARDFTNTTGYVCIRAAWLRDAATAFHPPLTAIAQSNAAV